MSTVYWPLSWPRVKRAIADAEHMGVDVDLELRHDGVHRVSDVELNRVQVEVARRRATGAVLPA